MISDFSLPQFSGLRALELAQASGLGIPLIIVSGTIGEETAIEAMRRGAADYLLKDRLTRLGLAVAQALDRTRLAAEREAAAREFAAASASTAGCSTTSPRAFIKLVPMGGSSLRTTRWPASPAMARPQK